MTAAVATLTATARTVTPVRRWPLPATGWAHLLQRLVTVEHITDSGVDAYGNAQRAVTSIDIVPGYIGPLREVEQLLEAETRTTVFELILPPGVPLDATDRVVIDGVTYEVREALHMFSPRDGDEHHVQARIAYTVG